MENKISEFVDLKIKMEEDNSPYDISAIVTKFDVEDKVGDIILSGALDKYIADFNAGKTEPLRMLKMHERSTIVGEWKVLEVVGDKVVAKGDFLTETQDGKDTKILVQKGLLTGVSMGFKSQEWSFNDDTGGITFKIIELIETSLVDFPAHQDAIVTSVKNFNGEFDLKVIAKALRNVGLSNKQAKGLISKGKLGLLPQRKVGRKKVVKLLEGFSLNSND